MFPMATGGLLRDLSATRYEYLKGGKFERDNLGSDIVVMFRLMLQMPHVQE
jgi:hypothetical protein